MIGTTISHYRILERLGEGGMGEVFRAEDLRLHRPVALKLLRQRRGCVEEERARLLREARAASSLNHPNIAVIYDVEESETPDGPIFLLAMEYVPGKTIAELVAQAPLPLDQILDFTTQIADALSEAHARGVVHRDIKPSNLMVARGRVKVLDFGLAQMQPGIDEHDSTWTRDAAASREAGWAGTPHYMSPEQALGKPLDARSDIFSLGVVLYELVSGRRPFAGNNVVQVANQILHHDPFPVPPRLGDSRLSEVERILARMLKKDPNARAADLREIRRALETLRSSIPPVVAASGAMSVAIAGFANITQQPEDEWLGIGLLETVTTALQEIEGLEVWSRDLLRETLRELDAEAGELRSEDAAQLGRTVGVRWVLAGGFQRSGEQVRVTMRVVESETGRVVRAVRSDGRLEDIFDLQDRIVAELASALRKTVSDAHEGAETQIVAAYQALSRGLLNIRADTYESVDRAILYFERALVLDPEYTGAQIELGAAYSQKAEYLAAPELHERSARILRRVLESHPRLPRVWRELGSALVAQSRVEEGLECLQRARSLAPEDPRVLGSLARALFIGKADFVKAADLYEQALARAPQTGWYWMQMSHCYALLRDYERGETAALRAIELQEAFLSGQQGVNLVGAYMRLAHLKSLQREFTEARVACESELAFVEELEHALRSRIRVELYFRLGLAQLGLGDEAAAAAAFDLGIEAFARRVSLGADEPATRYYAAAIYALRGAAESALGLLEGVLQSGSAFAAARAAIEPEWDGLRGNERFEKLIAPTRLG